MDVDQMLDANRTRAMVGAGTAMTLYRWLKRPDLNFPRPDLVVSGRRYWKRSNLEKWLGTMLAKGARTTAPAARKPAA